MNFKKREIQFEEIGNNIADYDIQLIRKLAGELIEISRIKKENYPFREEYLGKLIKKMGMQRGKFLIDLDDLPDNFILRFNDHGKNILKNIFSHIKSNYGLDRVNRRYISKNRGGIRIAQASLIDLTKEEKEFVLINSKTCIIKPSNKESKILIFSKLNESLKEKVIFSPSLILLSIQLLLRKYGINSKIYPLCVYISSNGIASISWHLTIIGFNEICKFYDLCESYISIKYKRNNLKDILNKQKLRCLPMGLRIPYYLVNALEIQNKKGCFTTKDIMSISNKKRKSVYATVGYLAQLNLISVIKKNKCIKFWNITKEGMKILTETCENKERWDYLLN